MEGAERVLIDDDLESTMDYMERNGWSDGLPIVPPTVPRVTRMIETMRRDPGEVVAVHAPRNGEATIERIAANAVMAGCRPEFFPVVVTAAEVMGDPKFPLLAINTTTNPVAIMCLINGPVRKDLNINCSYGLLGPGWRANASIGRAIRLIQLNIGGAIPGPVSKSTQGSPGRYAMCLGEYEEKSPWRPYHVDQGFKQEDSTVTLGAVTGTVATSDTMSKEANDLLITLSGALQWSGIQTMRYGDGYGWLLLNPDHAEILGVRGKLSKEQVRQELVNRTSQFPLEHLAPWEREHIRSEGRAHNGTTSVFPGPSNIRVVVAGGLGGLHATFCPPFVSSYPVTRRIPWPPGA